MTEGKAPVVRSMKTLKKNIQPMGPLQAEMVNIERRRLFNLKQRLNNNISIQVRLQREKKDCENEQQTAGGIRRQIEETKKAIAEIKRVPRFEDNNRIRGRIRGVEQLRQMTL